MDPRLAVVTGANRGLGLAASRELAARGMRVLLATRREAEGERAAAALAAGGRAAFVWPLDLDCARPRKSPDRFRDRGWNLVRKRACYSLNIAPAWMSFVVWLDAPEKP